MLFNMLQQLFKMLARRILMQDAGTRGDGRRQRAARWRRGTYCGSGGGKQNREGVAQNQVGPMLPALTLLHSSVAQFLGDMVTCQKRVQTAAVYAVLHCSTGAPRPYIYIYIYIGASTPPR
jgi:hypothetical protein